MMIACMAVLLAGYLILTWPKKIQPELPTVIVEPAEVGDVEIFGEYVGRIRAQQFVEVRARVEGYLESMLFAEGTYITKNPGFICYQSRPVSCKGRQGPCTVKER